MTHEQQQVKDWMSAFGQETPEKPVIPSLEVRKLRAKLILEEALETIEGLGFKLNDPCTSLQFNIIAALNHCSIVDPNLHEILDGCEDLKVVTEGTLVACGLVIKQEGKRTVSKEIYEEGDTGPAYIHYTGFNDPHFDEVMRSNWSKLWTLQEVEDILKPLFWPLVIEGPNIFKYQLTEHTFTFVKQEAAFKNRCWLVKDTDGKVIKSPSYSPPAFKIEQ